MSQTLTRSVPYRSCVALSVFLLAIGSLLVVNPKAGGRAFGTESQNAFWVATGVRQAYLGAIVLLMLRMRERMALGAVLLAMSAIPAADFLIARSAPDRKLGRAASKHLPPVPLVVGLGVHLLRTTSRRKGRGDRA